MNCGAITLSIMTLSIMTLCITTLIVMTLNTMISIVLLSINDAKHNGTQHWVSLCLVWHFLYFWWFYKRSYRNFCKPNFKRPNWISLKQANFSYTHGWTILILWIVEGSFSTLLIFAKLLENNKSIFWQYCKNIFVNAF